MPSTVSESMPDIHQRRAGAPIYSAAIIAGLLIAVFALKLWRADLSIPLYYAYGGDGLGQAALAKNIAQGGSSNWYPCLAAPLGAALYDFPTLSALHITIERLFILVSGNAYVALNLLFLFSFPATTVTALYALRRLDAPTVVAFPLAVAYTILPARFDRNEGHLFYATYWVLPLAVLLSVLLARGDARAFVPDTRRPTRLAWFAVFVGALIGIDNQYDAFFMLALLLMAASLAYLRSRSIASVAPAALTAIVIVGAVFGELLPTFIYHHEHGANAAAFERYPEESMTYGLQIAELVLPIENHRIQRIASKRLYYDQRTGLGTNENSWSSFGLLGTLGFFALLGVLVVRAASALPADIESLAIMNIWFVLISTVGGFGTLFNFFVRPEIRAYNRISTFLAFICISGLALLLAKLLRRRPLPGPVAVTIALGIIVFAFWDQTAPSMVPPYERDAELFKSDATLTTAVETSLAPNSAVFELPWVRYPESPPVAQLDPENLFRPYLHAKTLRFSYGAVDGRDPATWEELVGRMPANELVRNAALAGYDGILIFRAGYADGGAAIEPALHSLLGAPIVSPDGSLAFYSMRSLRERVVAAAPVVGTPAYQDDFVRVIGTYYEGSFSTLESDTTQRWRWSGNNSAIRLVNSSRAQKKMRLRARVEIPSGLGTVAIAFPDRQMTVTAAPGGTPIDVSFAVPPGQRFVRFVSSAPAVVVPGDPRTLTFRLVDPVLETAQAVPARAEAILASVRANISPADSLGSATASFVSGCSAQETSTTASWHWCGNTAAIRIESSRSGADTINLRASTPGQPTSLLSVSVGQRNFTVSVKPAGTDVSIPVNLTAGRPILLRMNSNATRLVAPGDPRTLVLRLDSFSILPR
jgi:phosphoglycerol transferase